MKPMRLRARLLAGTVAAYGLWRYRQHRKPPSTLVLEIDMSQLQHSTPPPQLTTPPTSTGLLSWRPPPSPPTNPSMRAIDAAQIICMAATDTSVCGLVAQFSEVGAALSLADAQELRDAVRHFRTAKTLSGGSQPFTCAHALEFGARTLDYFTASAFGLVVQTPSASIQMPSMSITLCSMRGLLARWGLRFNDIAPQMEADSRAQAGRTPSCSRGAARVLRSSYEQVVEGVASARGVSPRELERLARRGLMSSQSAMAEKLIDGALYPDQLEYLISTACPNAKR